MDLSARLAVFGFFVALLCAGTARADDQRFDLGFLKPGMPLAELRAAAWPPGDRILCGEDTDSVRIEKDSLAQVASRPWLAGTGVMACALFEKTKDGVWRLGTIMLGGNPATFWAMVVAPEAGAPPVLAEARMWQSNESFDSTVATLTGRLGPAGIANQFSAHWINDSYEVSVAHASGKGIITFLIDNRLRTLVTQRMPKPTTDKHP